MRKKKNCASAKMVNSIYAVADKSHCVAKSPNG